FYSTEEILDYDYNYSDGDLVEYDYSPTEESTTIEEAGIQTEAVNNVLPEVTTEDYVPGENYYEIIEETPRPSVSAGVNENVEEEYKEESLTGEDYDIDKKEIEEKKQDAKEYGVDEYEFKEYDVSEHDLREYDPNEYNVNYGDEYYYEIKEYEDSESTSNSTAREFGPGVPAETEFGSTAVSHVLEGLYQWVL
uniref:Uncharacterized protein n=1 Tax=Callorhinchus milii TaxID=7868 RepID=A0A4W3HYV8_CALMI